MTMDSDSDDGNARRPPASLPHVSRTNAAFIQITTSHSTQYPSRQEQQHQSLLASTTQHASCPVLFQALQLPSVDVQPEIPSDSLVGNGVQNVEFTQPTTRPSSPTAMSISQTSSWNANMISTTSRKQRFTMGPRADCEKCLLGVKGHWMHFD